MNLDDYLNKNSLSLAKFADHCGASASTILRVRDRAVAPSKRVMTAIWTQTGGLVCPNDIFGLHPIPHDCSGDGEFKGAAGDVFPEDRRTKENTAP